MPILRAEFVSLGEARGRLGGQIDWRGAEPLGATTLAVGAAATPGAQQPAVPTGRGTVFVELNAIGGPVYAALGPAPDPGAEPRWLVRPGEPTRLHARPGSRLAAVAAADIPDDLRAVRTGQAGSAGDGAVVQGGTAQTLFGGAVPPNGFAIGNPDPADDLWVSDSTAAAAGASGSVRVFAGGGYYETPPGYRPAGPVSVVGARTGQPVTARRW